MLLILRPKIINLFFTTPWRVLYDFTISLHMNNDFFHRTQSLRFRKQPNRSGNARTPRNTICSLITGYKVWSVDGWIWTGLFLSGIIWYKVKGNHIMSRDVHTRIETFYSQDSSGLVIRFALNIRMTETREA